MKELTISEINNLIDFAQSPCVTFYVPVNKGDRIRVPSRMLAEAERLLCADYSRALSETLLTPIKEFKLDRELNGTIVLFRSLSLSGYVVLPEEKIEHTIVAQSFHLKPLLDFLQGRDRHYLLCLTPYEAQFYEGSFQGLQLLWRQENFKALESASETKGKFIRRDSIADKIAFYIAINQRVMRSVWHRAPLIINGTKKDAFLYRCVNSISDVYQTQIDREEYLNSPKSLEEHAFSALTEILEKKRERAIHQLKQASDSIVLNLDKAIEVLKDKKALALYVSKDSELFGYLDWENGKAKVHHKQKGALDDDLLDDIAEKAIRMKIPVYAVESMDLPFGSPIAVIQHEDYAHASELHVPDWSHQFLERFLPRQNWRRFAA